MREAEWTRGNRTVKGRYEWSWSSERFFIELDQRDRTTGERTKCFIVFGDTPEWGNWKLVVDT